jgi:alanine racemase
MTVGDWKNWLNRVSQLDNFKLHQSRQEAKSNDSLRATQDSRQLPLAAAHETLFIAIRGNWHDGHDYLESAHRMGARYFIVEKNTQLPRLPDSDILFASNSLHAWQDFARHWRIKCDIPTIGITGSNGKTTVKEWLMQLFAKDHNACGNPRSYNSQVGVPLALGDLLPEHDIAFVEAGISEPDEMKRHWHAIQPTHGILTHIGNAHAQNFQDIETLAREKIQLFEGCHWVVMPGQLNQARELLTDQGVPVKTWGETTTDTLRVSSQVNIHGRSVSVAWNGFESIWHLPFTGEVGYRNAMTAALFALEWGIDEAHIRDSLMRFQDLDHRMQRLQKADGSWLISDAYTNDWDALQLAVQDLNRLPGGFKTAAIIGEIPGMDLEGAQQVVSFIRSNGMNPVWMIGPSFESLVLPGEMALTSVEEALELLASNPLIFQGKNTLIKGARAEQFERLIPTLMHRSHAARLELNLTALAHNLRQIRTFVRARAHPSTDLIAVIKASGYGTNGPAIARQLKFHGVGMLAVACTEEGVELRQHGVVSRIMILNPEPSTFASLIQHRLEPCIHSLQQHEGFVEALGQCGTQKPWPIHLKVDTGMHRLGFGYDETSILSALVLDPRADVKTIFSHLASADRPEQDDATRLQINRFETIAHALQQIQPRIKTHLLNSAGLMRFPAHSGDYVRVGISLFGVQPDGTETLELQSAVRFHTVISSLHDIPAGEGVGYGLEDASSRPRRVATLPLGYADGFPRNLSNGQGKVVIHHTEAPVVGKVCMDMVMVDVTDIPLAQEGDEVEVFGSEQSLEDFSADAGTIPYEILTRIPGRVQREQRGG